MDNVSSWIYLAVTSFSFTPFFGAGDSFGILLVIFVEYFNETNSKIGWVGSIKGSLGCAVYPFVVYLHRRFGFLTIVISAAFIGSFCYIATPFIPSANYLFFTYSIPLGLSIGLLDCVTIITIRDYFDKYLGVATGLRFSSISIGAITFNYLMPILIEAVGWKKTFFCLSSLGGVILIYALGYRIAISNKKLQPRTLLDEKRNVEAGDEICQKTRPENSHGSLRNKEFWLVLIASIPFGFVIAVPAMFTVQYAKTLGYPLSKAKWLTVASNSANLIARVSGGYLGGILSRKWRVSYMVHTAVISFGISSALSSLTRSLSLLILYMAIVGCLEGIYWVNLPLMMAEIIPGKSSDYAYSLMIFVAAFGYLLGPPTMGWLFDVTGDFRNVLYAVALCAMISGLSMALSNVVTSRSRAGSDGAQVGTTKNTHQAFRSNYFKITEAESNRALAELTATTITERETVV